MRDTHREAETQAEGEQAPCREPDVGLDPGSPGSHAGPKVALNRWATRKRVCKVAANYVINKLESWRQSPDQVEHMNRQALAFVARELKRLQVWFGKTAEQEILKYDGNYLAEQLENSVWYDLQMIRVNGSLVGAILGAVIYLVMYAVKGGAIL